MPTPTEADGFLPHVGGDTPHTSIPAEPAFYLHVHNDGEPTVLCVSAPHKTGSCLCPDGMVREVEILTYGPHGGVRGRLIRIPSAERLAAMEELSGWDAAIWSECEGLCECHFCDAPLTSYLKPLKHNPDCPWLRAQPEQEKQDA